MRVDTILHPTDFSDSADHALGVAVDLATRHGAVLHLFHGRLLRADNSIEPPLDGCAAAATAQAVRLVAQDPTRRLPEVHVGQLQAVSALDAIMERVVQLQPDLIVMGTHGRTGMGRLLLGNTAEHVLRRAPGNVVTVKSAVRPREPGGRHWILVPIDFSSGSALALDAARWLVRGTDTRLHLLHVVESASTLSSAGNLERWFDLDGDPEHRVERRLREWSDDIDGARWSVTEGNVPGEIARVARSIRADLVVMGTRGLNGVVHVLIGSVTEQVCRSSETPVLGVRDAA